MSRQKRQHLHRHRDHRIHKGGAEQRHHRAMRHQLEEGAGPGVDAEQDGAVLPADKAEDEGGDAERRDQADRQPIAREHRRESARPGVRGVGIRPRLGEHARDIDVEFMRRRELAIVVAGAAAMAEIGEVVEIAIGKRAAHFHGREHRAQSLAIAAGIADRHQPVGFGQRLSCVHFSPPPVPQCVRTRCRSSCRSPRHSRARAHCRP